MTCMIFKPLSCGSLGVGFLSQGNSCNTDTLQLMSGHGARFPALNANEYFNIVLSTPCQTCCTRLRVVATSGDTFTVEGLDTSTCSCFPENSRVSYDTTSVESIKDIASEVHINVLPPLSYDPCTRTLSVDCNALKQMVGTGCSGCGCS